MDKSILGHLSINSFTKELRKESLSIKNRLQSILYDALFVESVKDNLENLPLIPNERCGLWYVQTNQQYETAYFKSTDGHSNQWSFSLRRLNLHLLAVISKFGGIAIIDSTRKGKLMPDALSKTVPIWCAVLNCIMYEGETDENIMEELHLDKDDDDLAFLLKLKNENNWLHTPNTIISINEHNQISQLIKVFADKVRKLNLITKERLISDLGKRKPFVPKWYYPGCEDGEVNNDSFKFAESQQDQQYYSIYCITASKKTNDQGGSRISVRTNLPNGEIKITSWYYVQGSADDHELWATKHVCNGNLQPKFCWDYCFRKNSEVNTDIIDKDTGYIHDWLSGEELVSRMNHIYENFLKEKVSSTNGTQLDISFVKNEKNDTGIVFGQIDQNLDYSSFVKIYPDIKQVVLFTDKFGFKKVPESSLSIYHYKIESSKRGSKQLRDIFPKLIPNLIKYEKTMILCESGKDLSAGLVLLFLCKYFDLDWSPIMNSPKIDKDMVKRQLGLLLNVRKINPSRNTLQSVNTYIM